MCGGVILRFDAPIGRREQSRRFQDQEWMNQQRDHGKRHLAPADLLAEILRRTPYHLPRQKHADDQEEQQVDHSHALAAVNAVQPHADERREPCYWVQAVVLGVNRTARHIDCRGCEGRTRRRAKAQFLALEIAQMLIDRQPCDGWQGNNAFAPWRSRPSIRPYIRTSAIGNSIMQKVVKKFVPAFGFSSGWAEFMP